MFDTGPTAAAVVAPFSVPFGTYSTTISGVSYLLLDCIHVLCYTIPGISVGVVFSVLQGL